MPGAFPGGRGNIFGSPGRDRLSAEATPYRSKFYVSVFASTDGNDYQPGDPIPFDEAVRQGVIKPGERVPLKDQCSRCKGGKWFTNPRPKGHMLGCRCRFCGPCPRCSGSGREPEGTDARDGNAA